MASLHAASDKNAVIGTYGATSRRRITVRRLTGAVDGEGSEWRQVNREGNPLINELIIGTGFKDRFSVDEPANDKQFASFFLDPLLAHLFGSLGIPVRTSAAHSTCFLWSNTWPRFVQAAARKTPARLLICFG